MIKVWPDANLRDSKLLPYRSGINYSIRYNLYPIYLFTYFLTCVVNDCAKRMKIPNSLTWSRRSASGRTARKFSGANFLRPEIFSPGLARPFLARVFIAWRFLARIRAMSGSKIPARLGIFRFFSYIIPTYISEIFWSSSCFLFRYLNQKLSDFCYFICLETCPYRRF